MAKFDANKITITFDDVPLNNDYTPFVFHFNTKEWLPNAGYESLSEKMWKKIGTSMGVPAHLLGIYPEVIEDE